MRKRTVILIGQTGNGKSTIANVLAGRSIFEEGDSSVSITKRHQVEVVQIADDMELKIVDTIGLGDSSLTEEQVLFRLADACYAVREGISRIYFVIGMRLNRAESQVFNIIRSVIFDNDVTRFVTIIRPRFHRFRDAGVCQADIQRIKSERNDLAEMLNSCGDSMLYMDNPPEGAHPNYAEIRTMSRQLLLTQLYGCNEMYRPPELTVIESNVKAHIEEANKLQNENEKLKKEIETQTRAIQTANEEIQKMNQQFEAKMQTLQQQHQYQATEYQEQRKAMASIVAERANMLAQIELSRKEEQQTRKHLDDIRTQYSQVQSQVATNMGQHFQQAERKKRNGLDKFVDQLGRSVSDVMVGKFTTAITATECSIM